MNYQKSDPAERSRPLGLPGKVVMVDTLDFSKVDVEEIVKEMAW